MRVGSLFSGAGGLDMAVEAVFGATTAWHCEIDPAASKVLAHRWPGVPNHRDITTTDWDAVEPVDILCGGWPCQPWSSAGKQKGIEDERALWPFVARAVRALRPRFVVLENVPGIVVLGELARAVGDLAFERYDAQWTCVSAGEVGAPHRRKRMFILAHPEGQRRGVGDTEDERPSGGEVDAPRNDRVAVADTTCGGGEDRQERGGAAGLDVSAVSGASGGDHAGRLAAGVHGLDGAAPELASGLDLLPTPRASRGAATTETAYALGGTRSDDGDLQGNVILDDLSWGKYAAAITRWESLTRPVPAPTEPNSAGKPRLSPAFSEWLMGWPKGWVTEVPAIPRNEQLRIIGNGVVPQCATAALTSLLSLEAVA